MTTRQNAPARWALALLGAALLAGCGQEASNSAPAEAAASASKLLTEDAARTLERRSRQPVSLDALRPLDKNGDLAALGG